MDSECGGQRNSSSKASSVSIRISQALVPGNVILILQAYEGHFDDFVLFSINSLQKLSIIVKKRKKSLVLKYKAEMEWDVVEEGVVSMLIKLRIFKYALWDPTSQ